MSTPLDSSPASEAIGGDIGDHASVRPIRSVRPMYLKVLAAAVAMMILGSPTLVRLAGMIDRNAFWWMQGASSGVAVALILATLAITPVAVPTTFGGEDCCLLMTFHDQTPLRRIEEMRADFVANASHELRTPLAALSGFIDTLQGPARDDPKARERFPGIMHAQASRMARLIDDLLSLSRVELSAHVRPEKLIDVVPLVRQVIDGLEPLARERQVRIEAELPAEPVIVAGDSEELLRLVENLIENGLKYGASGGRVVVSLADASSGEGGGEVRFAVRDFGPGIAPEHLPRLTERFYRVDVGDSRAQGGTGLGLSLVKHILNRHRGRLLIESVAGHGATFTACFPVMKPAAPGAPVSVKE